MSTPDAGAEGLYAPAYLDRLRTAVQGALPRWGLDRETPLGLLAASENATFRTHGGTPDLTFRVYRAGYHSREEIQSELAWILALRAEGVVDTPRPVPLGDGSLIADIDDGGIVRHVAAFELAGGHEPGETDDLEAWFHRLGTTHARLHAHARRWSPPAGFTRKRWTFETTLGRAPLWGDYRAALGLDAAGRTLLERTAAVLEARLSRHRRADAFGLIHGDLRLANLLVDGERLILIDFDDCGFSWFLYDFASAISFVEHEPYIPALTARWMEGYRTVAPLADMAAEEIDTLVMLRRILLTAWIASHHETDTARALGPLYTDGTLALAEAFLSRHSTRQRLRRAG